MMAWARKHPRLLSKGGLAWELWLFLEVRGFARGSELLFQGLTWA